MSSRKGPAWPGAPIAELPDSPSFRLAARVDETDRSRLGSARQPVRVEALPDKEPLAESLRQRLPSLTSRAGP
jgi:hypothetical protein